MICALAWANSRKQLLFDQEVRITDAVLDDFLRLRCDLRHGMRCGLQFWKIILRSATTVGSKMNRVVRCGAVRFEKNEPHKALMLDQPSER